MPASGSDLQPDPDVDGATSVREREHRIEIELCDLRQLRAEERQAMNQIHQRNGIHGRIGSKTTHQLPGLSRKDELARVDVRQGRDPERRLADQLGELPSRAERNERPEQRILDEAGKKLDS